MHRYTLYINLYNCDNSEENEDKNPQINSEMTNYYINLEKNSISTEDSGVDLFVPENQTFDTNKVGSINHQIRCFMKDTHSGTTTGYYLYPRSSIYKYPLMAANSVGIIDAGYRGNILAKVRCFENNTQVTMGSKLFQICAPDLSPLNVKLIPNQDFISAKKSARGANGFGSSGR